MQHSNIDTGPQEFLGRPSISVTLRDYFAASVMPAFLALPGSADFTPPQLAVFSYEVADAMLEARNAAQ